MAIKSGSGGKWGGEQYTAGEKSIGEAQKGGEVPTDRHADSRILRNGLSKSVFSVY